MESLQKLNYRSTEKPYVITNFKILGDPERVSYYGGVLATICTPNYDLLTLNSG